MKNTIILNIILVLILSCSGKTPGVNSAPDGSDATGKTKSIPDRIITLNPAITENLYILGVQDKIIGNTNYCNRPPAASKKTRIGNIVNFDVEKVISLKPDLVLSTTLANEKKLAMLRGAGIIIRIIPKANNFQELCKNFITLGEIVGSKKYAEKIIRDTRKKVDRIKERSMKMKKVRVFMQIGAKPLATVTSDYHLNDCIRFAGGLNISAGAKLILYNREAVLEANPEVIIITTMGITGENEQQQWQRYRNIDAVKNNRIHIVNSDIFCTPTPTTFLIALRETYSLLHPKKGGE